LWGVEISFIVSQCLVKLAVLAILNRFVKDTSDTRIRYAIWGAATLTITYSLGMIFALFILCRPFQAYWLAFDQDWAAHHNFRCFNQTACNLLAGVVAVLSDLYTIAIPWAISRSFGLTKRQTLALNTVFMFGLIVTAASCIRTYYFYYALRGIDVPDNLMGLAIWATLETYLAIICACMPSLRVLYRLIVQSRMSNVARQRIYLRREPDSVDVEQSLQCAEVNLASCHSRSSFSAGGNQGSDITFSSSSIKSTSTPRKPSPKATVEHTIEG
jgi:hypothetical protein